MNQILLSEKASWLVNQSLFTTAGDRSHAIKDDVISQ